MLNMYEYGKPQNLVLIKVWKSEKIPSRHFIKHLVCTHYTYVMNNAWTCENHA